MVNQLMCEEDGWLVQLGNKFDYKTGDKGFNPQSS
jgi:hypothetical protein